MVPARSRQYNSSYGGCYNQTQLHCFRLPRHFVGLMAEEEEAERGKGTQGKGGGGGSLQGDQGGEVGTSGEGEEGDQSWLQLGIGLAATSSATPASRLGPRIDTTGSSSQRAVVELDLFSERPRASRPTAPAATPAAPVMPLFGPSQGGDHVGLTWGLWGTAGPSAAVPLAPYGSHQFLYFPPDASAEGGRGLGDVRVVSPPTAPRRQTGLWFVLQAAHNQMKEPFLPQIPKCYLRIKDGRMTIRLLMKYLVNKLGLGNESEVEITCRGQPLPSYLTLQHVRDSIWYSGNMLAFSSDSPSNHVMTLQYARSLSTSSHVV